MSIDDAESKFSFTKYIKFKSERKFENNANKLTQLQKDKDTFTEVHIPPFSFDVDRENLSITIQSEFIKGHFVGHNYSNILYRNLVERESEWTFADYHIPNFIKQDITNKIYCVDLQSYKKMDVSKRKELWDSLRKNRVIGNNGWGSQVTECRFCRKTIQDLVNEYTFFGGLR